MDEKRIQQASWTIEAFLMMYVFPVQLIVGLTGNACNLIVLLSREMRTKTNTLLAMMALADMLFLAFMVPHSLMFHASLTRIPSFRYFIVHAMPHLAGICNLCSFVSAWLVVVVCGERVMAVLCPLRARSFWTTKTLLSICALIWVCAVMLSMHAHITHRVQDITINITTLGKDGLPRQQTRTTQQAVLREGMQGYWQLAVSLDILFLVFLPVCLVITANLVLISRLHRRKASNAASQRRATMIVSTIATAFTICQIPSALVYIWEMVAGYNGSEPLFRTFATLSNSIVVTGKATNFFLFCTWSSNFRKRLAVVVAYRTPSLFYFLQSVMPGINKALPAQDFTYFIHRHRSCEQRFSNSDLLRHVHSLPVDVRFGRKTSEIVARQSSIIKPKQRPRGDSVQWERLYNQGKERRRTDPGGLPARQMLL